MTDVRSGTGLANYPQSNETARIRTAAAGWEEKGSGAKVLGATHACLTQVPAALQQGCAGARHVAGRVRRLEPSQPAMLPDRRGLPRRCARPVRAARHRVLSPREPSASRRRGRFGRCAFTRDAGTRRPHCARTQSPDATVRKRVRRPLPLEAARFADPFGERDCVRARKSRASLWRRTLGARPILFFRVRSGPTPGGLVASANVATLSWLASGTAHPALDRAPRVA